MEYQPEFGQMLYGNPSGEFAMPDYAEALVIALLNDIGRVYSNVYQASWNWIDEPNIPGIEFHPYWWGDEEDPGALLPNFAFEGVEIRWYKYAGRGMSCNRELTPDKWASWFSRCLEIIWEVDVE